MHAGRLDRVAIIESPTTTRDAYGATVPGWSQVAQVMASVQALAPREMVADAAQVSVMTFRVWLHYRSDVLPSYRIRVDGMTLLIRGVAEFGRRRWLQLTCEQVI